MTGPISFTIFHEGSNQGAPKSFTLKDSEKAIRIGRAPGNDFVIDHRGISQFHAEFRLLANGGESGGARLCVRDLSMNGTGMKKLNSTAQPIALAKNTDEPIHSGTMLVLPLRMSQKWKAGEDANTADRFWFRIEYGSEQEVPTEQPDDAPPLKPPRTAAAKEPKSEPAGRAASPAAASDRSSEQGDSSEGARKRFVELLLKTKEVSAGTTYDDAEKILGHEPDWISLAEKTRRETLSIFVDHLGSHNAKKKTGKKKSGKDKGGKDRDKGSKPKRRDEEDDARRNRSPSRDRSRRKRRDKNGSKQVRSRDRSLSASRSRSRRPQKGRNRRGRSRSGSN